MVWHALCRPRNFVSNKNIVVRAFVKRGAIFSIFLLMVLVAIGFAFQGGGNPTIQQGGTSSFLSTGTDAPAGVNDAWDIVNPVGGVIATDLTANGWNVVVVNDTFTVTAPLTSVVGTSYKVRFAGTGGSFTRGMSPSVRAAKMSALVNEQRDFAGRSLPSPTKAAKPSTTKPPRKATTGVFTGSVSKSALFDVVSAGIAPNAPTGLTAAATASNRINLAWTDNSLTEGGFKIYRLQDAGAWTLVTSVGANVTTYSDIPLIPSTTYTYKVTAFNGAGESTDSNQATQTTYSSTVIPAGYAGNDFYVVIPDNMHGAITNQGGPKLRISSTSGATGLLTTVETGDSVPFTVPTGGSTMVSLSSLRRLLISDQVSKDSYRVTCDNAVNVEFVDYNQTESESWSVLPNTILGTEYVTSNYNGGLSFKSQFAIVATDDNTLVTIKPTTLCGSNRPANVQFAVTLQRGETYLLKALYGDLTGTIVKSSKPIGVVSGSQGTRVQDLYAAANPLEEQLLPFDRWQYSYVGVPFANHPHAQFRLTSARNQTIITVTEGDTGTVSNYTLNAGQFVEIETTSPILVNANKPIQGMQLSQSQDRDYVNGNPLTVGDPMMITMPTSNVEDWQTSCNIVVAPGDGFDGHYVTLVSHDHQMTTIKLNGIPITGWQSIGSSRLKFVRVALSAGNNVINGTVISSSPSNASAKFMAMSYAFGLYDAIGSVSGGLTVANNYVNVHPNDPTNLVATAFSSTEIDLGWTDNASNEYGFRVERKTETGQWTFVADKPANTVAFRDSGLVKKTKYYYRVIAYADEDSNPSNTAFATTLNEKPAAPVGLSAIAQSDSEIRLTWVDSSDNEDSFIVERKQDSVGTWGEVKTTEPNAVTWTNTGLTKKTAYSYRVKARNEIGDSDWSNISGDTTKDTKPNKPLNLVATPNSYSQITLTWTDDSNNEDTFRIERKTATTSWITIGTKLENQKSFVDYDLTGDTTYTYRVFAVNNGGDSLPSNEASATTLLPPPPSAPTNLTANAIYEDEVELKWTDTSLLESGFHIQHKVSGGNWNPLIDLPTNSTSFSDTTALPSTTYVYRVRANNSGGNSGWSNEATTTTPNAPPLGSTPYLQSVDVVSDCLVGGGNTTGTVRLNIRTNTSRTVALSTSSNSVSVPASVVIPAGQRAVNFPVTVNFFGSLSTDFIYGSLDSWMQKVKVSAIPSYSAIAAVNQSRITGAGGVWIQWETTEEDVFGKEIGGFIIKRKSPGGSYAPLNSVPTTYSEFVDATAVPGTTYFYRVDLVSSNGSILSAGSEGSPVTIGTSGGTINWIDQPSATSSGVVTVSASQSSGVGQMIMYVDGKPMVSLHDNNDLGFGDDVLVGSFDTRELANGNHSFFLASKVGSEILSVSSIVQCQVTNTNSNDNSDGIADTVRLLYNEIHATLPMYTSAYTINIKDWSGNVIRSWTGFGTEARVVWDGRSNSGAAVADGNYTTEVKGTGQLNGKQTFAYRVGVLPKFLSLIVMLGSKPHGVPVPQDYEAVVTQTHRDLVETVISSASNIKTQFDPSFSYAVVAIPEEQKVSSALMKSIRYWLKSSVQYFFHLGHGVGPKSATDWRHSLCIGSNGYINNFSTRRTWSQIDWSEVAQNKAFKFMFLFDCNAFGKDLEHGDQTLGYMTPTPNNVWATISHVNMVPYDGCLIGFNGQSVFLNTFDSASTSKNCWYRWIAKFWQMFGQNNYVTDCLVAAHYAAGVQDTPRVPWTINPTTNLPKMVVLGDTRAVP